jgi:hypothetical protein
MRFEVIHLDRGVQCRARTLSLSDSTQARRRLRSGADPGDAKLGLLFLRVAL